MMTDQAFLSDAATGGPARRRWDRVILLSLVALLALGVVLLVREAGWEETRAAVARLTVGHLVLLLALSLANYGARALRWHLCARRLGLPTSLPRNALHFVAGFAMSVTPGRVGELVRSRWLWRETGWPFARTAPLMLIDRAADLAAMAAILGATVALSGMGPAAALPVTLAAFGAAALATRPGVLNAVAGLGYRLTGRCARLCVRLRHAAQSLDAFRSFGIVAVATLLGAAGWMAEGWAFHLLLGWMGADIRIAPAIAIFVFSTLAGGLTGAPGGVGGAEAAMVALLTLEGVPPEISVPATLVIRATTLWFALLIGLAAFPVAERSSARISAQPPTGGRHALEGR